MFSVKAIVSRGIFRDKLLIETTDDVRHSRQRLGWDVAGAPEVKVDEIRLSRGEEFTVLLPKGSAAIGQLFSLDQAADLPGFNKLWKRVEG